MQRWGNVGVAMPTRCLERHNIRPDGNTAAVRLDYIVSRVHAYAGVPRGCTDTPRHRRASNIFRQT